MYGEPDGTETGAPPFTEVSGPLLPSVSRPLSPKLYLGFRLPYGSMYFWALSADGLFFSEWGKNSIFFPSSPGNSGDELDLEHLALLNSCLSLVKGHGECLLL